MDVEKVRAIAQQVFDDLSRDAHTADFVSGYYAALSALVGKLEELEECNNDSKRV